MPQGAKRLPRPLADFHVRLFQDRLFDAIRPRLVTDYGWGVLREDSQEPLRNPVQAVQKCPDARRAKTEERGVYGNTLSDEVCSATQQMGVLEAPRRAALPGKEGSVLSLRP